jgi:hypothetical protein
MKNTNITAKKTIFLVLNALPFRLKSENIIERKPTKPTPTKTIAPTKDGGPGGTGPNISTDIG